MIRDEPCFSKLNRIVLAVPVFLGRAGLSCGSFLGRRGGMKRGDLRKMGGVFRDKNERSGWRIRRPRGIASRCGGLVSVGGGRRSICLSTGGVAVGLLASGLLSGCVLVCSGGVVLLVWGLS